MRLSGKNGAFGRGASAPAWWAGCAVLVGCLGAGASAQRSEKAVTAAQAAFFETKIRPVLAANCFSCHGASAPQGGLRLDDRAHLLRGGASGPALVPGDPDRSLLLRTVRHLGKIQMPPGGKLKDAEIADLAAWVKQGAPWPGAKPKSAAGATTFWSFRAPKRVASPKVKNAAWVRSSIDAFVLAGLEAKGLTPAPPANKRTLLRRVTFDLIGLPPTPDEIAAFLADQSPNAFAKVVDRLLASPRYGERWGRHWLDVARYADSNGLDENKAFAHAWRYRDWVIDALNRDEPYDQFVREQLAGDLLPTGDEAVRNRRVTATGFLTLGAKVLAEQDKPKLVMDIVDEQIEVTSKAFLGLTVACARCHDHKFDPISTKDYYALAGIFKSTKTMRDLGFVSNWNERTLPSRDLEARQKAYAESLKPLRDAVQKATEAGNADLLASIRRDAGKYLLAGWELSRQPGAVSLAESPERPGDGPRILVEAENFDRGNANKDTKSYGAGIGVIHTVATPTFAEWDVSVPSAGDYQLELRYAAMESRPVALAINGKRVRESAAAEMTGSWNPDGQRWEVAGVFPLAAGRNTLRIERDGSIPHFDKIFLITAPKPDPNIAPRSREEIAREHDLIPAVVQRWAQRLRAESVRPAALGAAETDALLALPDKPEAYYTEAAQAALKRATNALLTAEANAPQTPTVMAVDEGKIEDVRVHIRGSTESLGDLVPRRFPAALAGERQAPIPASHSGRRELAEWLTRPDHPLTARVAVNRIWQHLFGDGLVRTPDNWGLTGERPDNPALLDWLAVTFAREDGWSQKRLIRRIVLSSAYRMSSAAPNPRAARLDPENRLLWRMNRRRLEAEPFRDAILAVSGDLDAKMGGSLLTTPDNDYVTNDQSADAARYNAPRRSIYLPVVRNAVFDLFQAFDFGDPTTVNAHRAATIVAPQALWVMNSPFVMEQARLFAADLRQQPKNDDTSRLRRAYLRALARSPSAEESKRALAFLDRYTGALAHLDGALAAGEPDAARRRERAWESLCHILFASNEFLYVD